MTTGRAVVAMRPERWTPSIVDCVGALCEEDEAKFEALFTPRERGAMPFIWRCVARGEQEGPPGDWRVWLIMAGRGFGKTRAGAEWVDAFARANPGCRIALVGASQDDVRNVMIEGESGILAAAGERERPIWQPALRRVMWAGGAMATCYSAAEPEGLRGPQHHIAWADEVARWDASGGRTRGDVAMVARTRGQRTWDNLLMGLRLGACPRVCATTTPRAVPLMRTILAMDGLVRSGGSTLANAANLPAAFVSAMREGYGDTLIGRQEIGGELIEDVPGALWTRAMLEGCRVPGGGFSSASPGGLCSSGTPSAPRSEANAAGSVTPPSPSFASQQAGNLRYPLPQGEMDGLELEFARVLIGVDPPASSEGDACGIVVVGLCSPVADDGTEFVVLDDASVERASPERWARAVAEAAARWGADRIVAEANNGGDMVRSVLAAEDRNLPVTLVHATRGKSVRAEPVAHAYARGRVRHAGVFAALEDQLCGLQTGGGYAGPGRSPDRADACVWALTELMRGARFAGPRVRML